MAVTVSEGGTSGSLDEQGAAEGADAAIELANQADASRVAVVAQQRELWSYTASSDIPAEATKVIAVLPERHLLDPEVQPSFTGPNPSNPIVVIDGDELSTALGVALSPAQRAAYRAGAAVVTDPRFITDGTIEIGAWSARDAFDGKMPDNIWTPWKGAPPRADPLWEEDIEAIELDAPHQPIAVAIAPETAADFDLAAQPLLVIASFDTPVPVESRDRVYEQAVALSDADWVVSPQFEDGPPDDAFWMIPILAAVGVLVLGASGVALSLARLERRPDDATLSAVGGTDGLRRRIGFWQGLIIAGFGTLAGAVAGVLPPIGFAIQSRGVLLISDIPWLVLALLAIALPSTIAAVSWLVPPRRADLTRRTAIA